LELAEVELLVGELELRVDRLRALYDQYFMGIEKLEPMVPRKDVERRFQVLRKEQIRNTAVRFKFQTVLQRYNTYQTYWMRICRQIEEGTYRRDVLRANQRFGGLRKTVPPPRPASEPPTETPPTETPAPTLPVAHDFESLYEDAQHAGSIDVDFDLLTEDPFPKPPPSQQPAHGIAESKAKMRIAPMASQAPPRSNPSLPPGAVLGPERRVMISPRAQSLPPPSLPLDAEGKPLRRGPTIAPLGTGPISATLVPPRGPTIAPLGGTVPPRGPTIAPRNPAAPPTNAAAPPRPPTRSSPDLPPIRERAPSVPDAAQSRPRVQSSPDLPPMRERAPSVPEATQSRPRVQSSPNVPPMRDRAASVPDAAQSRPRVQSSPDFPPMRDRASSIHDVPSSRASAPPSSPSAPGSRSDIADDRVRQLYSQYIETKRKQNESTASITYESMASSLRASSEKLKQKHGAGKSVDFEVVVKDGKTILRPVVK
jgi:hypothetical protein